MSNSSPSFVQQDIHDQNIYSFAKFKKLDLAFYLNDALRENLQAIEAYNDRHDITFVDSVCELESYVSEGGYDAIVIDVSNCVTCGFDCLQRITNITGRAPVIAIGTAEDEAWHQTAFEMGVEDIIPFDEATPRHLMRIIGYAIVRNQNLIKVREFERRHQGIVENATEGIFQTTTEGRYVLANPALAELYGFENPQALKSDLTNIATQLYVDPERREEFARIMRENDVVTNFESQIRRKDGRVIWISENARAVRDDTGRLLYFEGFVRDITPRKENETKLRYLAQRDSLTGLPNRALYQDRLAELINRASKDGSKFGVLFIDLDNFKRINDTMGHPVGDIVLQKVAERLLSCVKASDTVARLSGDEFTVILSELPHAETAARVASRILDSLAKPFDVNNKQIYSSGSIGVSVFPDNGANISELMQSVDTAAYHAKKLGRNTFQFYTENLSTQAIRRLEIEDGLRHALEKGEFTLNYQPKVDLQNRHVIGAEALLRWHNSELGFVSPDEFIPIAEETGLIIPIGEWVISEACKQIRLWLDQGYDPGCVAVNISARQFHRKGLVSVIHRILQENSLSGSRLELELTESALVEHVDEAVAILKAVADMGISASIDDFGTGYSSLSYLKKFPISALKIDRSFIMDIPNDQEDMAITRAIISLGKALDLKIVAEGIEDVSQCTFLNALNCDIGQGYEFSKPVPAAEFEEFLVNKKV